MHTLIVAGGGCAALLDFAIPAVLAATLRWKFF